jgi:hypothetical protein
MRVLSRVNTTGVCRLRFSQLRGARTARPAFRPAFSAWPPHTFAHRFALSARTHSLHCLLVSPFPPCPPTLTRFVILLLPPCQCIRPAAHSRHPFPARSPPRIRFRSFTVLLLSLRRCTPPLVHSLCPSSRSLAFPLFPPLPPTTRSSLLLAHNSGGPGNNGRPGPRGVRPAHAR